MGQDYTSVVEAAKTDVLRLLEDEEGWAVVKTYGEEEEITMECKQSETLNCNVYRSAMTVNALPHVVNDTFPLTSTNRHMDWTLDVKDMRTLDFLENDILLFSFTTHNIAKVVSSRSFVVVGRMEANDDDSFLRYGTQSTLISKGGYQGN